MTTMPADPSDAPLLDRIARGDADALGALYDRHASRVLGLTSRILSDRDEAEDVLQEVFLQVWRAPARFDASRGSVLTWLLVVARSRAIDRLRALRRRGRDRHVDIAAVDVAAPGDPERETQTSHDADGVRRVLATLPADQRRALELAYFEGYTQSEIADLTGSPLGTVKTRLRQGMMKLRESFKTYSEGGGSFASL
jgi:RNA polymerase sigma-70 factor (ECF subfamily)